MLTNENTVESSTGEIKIKDFSAKTMKNLLYFIYHDTLDKGKLDSDLLLAADKYDLPNLVRICVDHLGRELREENVLDVMKSAYLTGHKALFQLTCKFVKSNENIVETKAFEEMKKNHPALALDMLSEVILSRKNESD